MNRVAIGQWRRINFGAPGRRDQISAAPDPGRVERQPNTCPTRAWRKSPTIRVLSGIWFGGISSAGTTTDARQGAPTIDDRLFDRSAGALSAAWWRFVMSKPVDANPLKDPTGARCAQGQSGPVFFLAGSSTRLFQVRDKCVVPAGNVLFFPVVNGVVRHRRRKLGAAGPANNDFRACAGTVRRCSAPAFSLTLPDQSLFGICRREVPTGSRRWVLPDAEATAEGLPYHHLRWRRALLW